MSGDTTSWTVKDVLTWTTNRFRELGIDTPRLDAELIIAHVLGRDRVGVYLDLLRPLSPEERARIRAMVARRQKREPMAYILGVKEFYGRSFVVDQRVLIPRPDTETLVECVLERVKPPASVLEVGVGSGAVLITLGLERPGLELHGTDISSGALEITAHNAQQLGAQVHLYAGSLVEPLEGRRFAVVLSNPPYVEEDASLEPELSFEPPEALFAVDRGMAVIRALIDTAPGVLEEGGWLILEVGAGQATETRALLEASPWVDAFIQQDLAGIERVCGARLGA